MNVGRALGAFFAVLGCGGSRTPTQVPGDLASGASQQGRAGEGTNALATLDATRTLHPDAGDDLPVTVATAKAHADGKHYALDVSAPGTVVVGGTGALQVVLVAKDGYHINDEFPYKLQMSAEPRGVVAFETSELSRKDGTYTKTGAHFNAKFVGARGGVAKIGGTMALSVCTKKECVIDKIDVEVPVTVR